MLSIPFWKSWPAIYQRFFWLLTGLFVFTIIYLWVSDFYAPGPVFTPRQVHHLESVEFSSHTFHLGIVELPVPADAYLIFERTVGSTTTPNLVASYIFLTVLMISAIVLMTVFTMLGRSWFYAGMGFSLLFIVSLKPGSVQLAGISDKIPAFVVLLLLGLPSYYFQFIKSTVNFTKRFLTFAVLVALIGLVIYFFAQVPQPFLLLSANGLIAGTIIMLVLIFTAAHEILASLVVLISSGNRQTKSLQHFLIISAIYLVNLGLLYANKKHWIEWSFLPVNLFLFITVSGMLGLWGIHQRQPVYDEIIKIDPFGVFLYVSLAAIGFGTMGCCLATSNDPVIQLAQDAILYSHLGYGLIFVLYVVSNFGSMLVNNLQVYRVLYKPTNMPYFTFRFAGLIVTFAFFAYSSWKTSINQVYAGYYNAYGDIYFAQDTLSLAEGSYKRSTLYALRNYHAHYAMANIYASREEGEKEKNEYQLLADSRPLGLAYLNLSETYERDNSLSGSAHVLQQGLHDFPKDGLLENELGLVYSQLNKKDSAWQLINLARSSRASKKDAETNLIGLSAKFKLPYTADSLLALWGSENPGSKTNALALASVQGKIIPADVDPGPDTVLTIYSILSLHNFLISHQDPKDSALIAKTIQLARKNANPYYVDFLLSAAAYANYDNGQTSQAIKLLRELAYTEQEGRFNNTIGLWALEQNAPDRAVKYFDEALKQDYTPALFNRALALTESADLTSALPAWDTLKTFPDSASRSTRRKMISALNASPKEALQLTDEGKYLYARYKIPLADNKEFETLLSSMADPDLKARAILDRSKKFDEADEIEIAWPLLASVSGLKLKDKNLYEEITQHNLLFLARRKNWSLLEQKMHSGISFQGKYKLNKAYLEALLDAAAGKTQDAEKKFRFLVKANPFFEDAIVAGVGFLNLNAPDKLTTYSTLVDALELNPDSIKLLKAYIVLSAQLDFEENAQRSLAKLKTLMSPSSYRQFVENN